MTLPFDTRASQFASGEQSRFQPVHLARSGYVGARKRAFDMVVTIVLLPFILPVMLGIWIAVRSDGGPFLFAHVRVGRGGKPFSCLKIRTMVPDAEQRLKEHLDRNPAAALEWVRDHKLADDPRITRVGRFLRKTRLDELPQFFNVLKGDMSVVGPRPVTQAELDRYGHAAPAYMAVRPGVTGQWQVAGNGCSYAERVAFDLDYIRNASLLRDLRLVAQTVGVVLRMTGR